MPMPLFTPTDALRPPTRRRRVRGVTLIELLVVISIVAILSAIAMPSFVSTTQKYRTISETNSFFVDLQYARSEAIRRGANVVICASTNGSSCSGTAANWRAGWIIGTDPAAGTMTVFRKQAAWAGTDTFSAEVSAVLFTVDGYATGFPSGATLVTFIAKTATTNNNATQCVSINSVGRQQKLTYSATGTCK